jgi:Ca-activated chloride channel family protein
MGVDPMRRIRLSAVAAAGLLLAACGGPGDGGESSGTGWPPDYPGPDGQTFEDYGVNPEVATAEDHQSTFGLDVDTGSYTVARSYLTDGRLPDPAAVRTEEFINLFRQDYQPPADGIGIHLDGTAVPFLPDPGKRVLRVGLPAAVLEAADRPPANLTLVVDTSGSMEGLSLEMVQAGLSRLVDSLRPDDRVAIVSYSDDAALRLPMTPRSEEAAIRRVISELSPQASTNLEAGLRVGYQ